MSKVRVYLGEVQTTRKIKKLVLTGEETSWQSASASEGRNRFTLPILNAMQADTAHFTSLSTHLSLGVEGATWNIDDVYTIVSSKLYMRLTAQYNSLADFKTYLQQQYAAGTPVTVWYVLAEPTTGIVNEPLMKIGEYADEVSGITIPTIAGADTLSVDTTLQPSEVSVNYKGWHPVADVHEKSRNLFDENYPNISGTLRYIPLYVGEGSFTLSTTTPYDSSVANVFLLSGNVSTGASTPENGAWLNHNVTTQSVNGYVTIAYRHYSGTTSPTNCQTMLNAGTTALLYEPYWN